MSYGLYTWDPIKDTYKLNTDRVKFVRHADDELATDGHRSYDIVIDGETVGEVWRFRASASGEFRKGNSSRWGKGSWRWSAVGAPEPEYSTRSAAVAEAIRAKRWGEHRCPDDGRCHHACPPGACFRVHSAGPLSGVFPGDVWPASVRETWVPAPHLTTGLVDDR